MSRRRSSSDRVGPAPSGRTEGMETGFSSPGAAPPRNRGSRGAGGGGGSGGSLAASVVVSRRTPPVPASQGPVSASRHVQTLSTVSLIPERSSSTDAKTLPAPASSSSDSLKPPVSTPIERTFAALAARQSQVE